MEDTSRMSPHILRRTVGAGDREAVADVTVEGARALLVFADGKGAAEFMDRTPGAFAESEAVPVSPAEISETCARHGIGLCALFSFLEPGDLSVVSVEAIPEVFEA